MPDRPGKPATIAIVTDDPGWHGRALSTALNTRGLQAVCLSLRDCFIHLVHKAQDIILPGFSGHPAAVFVRGVPGGSLEQVIARLDILHGLQASGVVVYNGPRAIERTVDKPLTSLLLSRAGLPTPMTWIGESQEQARVILREQTAAGGDLVQKPLFGSQGEGLHRVNYHTGLMHDEKFAGVYYLQQFIEQAAGDHFDLRVLVIDGKAQAAMKRSARHWLTNGAQGARCEPWVLDPQLAGLAEQASKVLGVDYAGVDLMPDRQGHLHVIEVNSIPAWKRLQRVTPFNIAERLIDALVDKLTHHRLGGV